MAKTLTQQQIANLWVQQGGDPKYANLMARIALRESGGRPKINNRGTNSNGTVDWGLYQVNDIWRKDPVVGPLFQSGAILTPQGATKAAIHILKTQGPQAWATYNAATDKQYLGGFHGSGTYKPSGGGGGGRVTTYKTTSTDPALRQQAALNYLSDNSPDALINLASSLAAAKVTSTRKVRSGGGGGNGGAQAPANPGNLPTWHKPKDLFELFWQGPGGVDVKYGQLEPQGFVSGHTDHVHVAANRKAVVKLGKLAQRMGLNVGENPHFGGVHPVHAPHSFHYSGRAIDVSGDPAKERAFARRVARYYGVK